MLAARIRRCLRKQVLIGVRLALKTSAKGLPSWRSRVKLTYEEVLSGSSRWTRNRRKLWQSPAQRAIISFSRHRCCTWECRDVCQITENHNPILFFSRHIEDGWKCVQRRELLSIALGSSKCVPSHPVFCFSATISLVVGHWIIGNSFRGSKVHGRVNLWDRGAVELTSWHMFLSSQGFFSLS